MYKDGQDSPDSIVIVIPGEFYRMQLLGAEKPRVRVTLNDAIGEHLTRSLVELSRGLPKVGIKISVDDFCGDNQRSVVIEIVARSTPNLLSMLDLNGGDRPAMCSITFHYQPETTDRFLKSCQERIGVGNNVPITILDSKERTLCTFAAEIATSFSWLEMIWA